MNKMETWKREKNNRQTDREKFVHWIISRQTFTFVFQLKAYEWTAISSKLWLDWVERLENRK